MEMKYLSKKKCMRCESNNIEEVNKYLRKCKDCGFNFGTNVWAEDQEKIKGVEKI